MIDSRRRKPGSSEAVTCLFGSEISRLELSRRTGHMRQVAGISLAEYGDGPERGVRFLEFRSGSGLEFRVLVDRGMDIGELRLNGVPLSWRSPTGFRSPSHWNGTEDDGMGLLRSFDGFLVTCGLDHVRAATRGTGSHFGSRRTEVPYPMHGRISMSPGTLSGYGEKWQGETCTLWCEGVVGQSMLYGENLVLKRRISIELGTSVVEICDQVTNAGFLPIPHLLLYHFNFGFPLLDENADLLIAPEFSETRSSPGRLADFDLKLPPQGPVSADDIVELSAAEKPCRKPSAALVNRRLGAGMAVALEFDSGQLPYLQLWQNLSDGMYVASIEPALQPIGRREELERDNSLRSILPGQTIQYDLKIAAYAGKDEIDRLSIRLRDG